MQYELLTIISKENKYMDNENTTVAGAEETVEHVITQEDIDANPGIEADVAVGDVVGLAAETEAPAGPEECQSCEA